MPEQNEDPVIGGDEPLKPSHSLPRYSEPTPETRGKLSREDEAELALKNTTYTFGTRWLLIFLFVLFSRIFDFGFHNLHIAMFASAITLGAAIFSGAFVRALRLANPG